MKILFKLLSVILFMGAVGYGAHQYIQAKNAREEAAGGGGGQRGGGGPLDVDVLVIEPERVAWTARAVGTVEAWESVPITSEQSRRLVAIHADEGQVVAAGDLLFTLEDTDLQAELRELAATRERSRLREARLEELRRTDAVSLADYDDARLATEEVDAQMAAVQFDIDRSQIRAPFPGRLGRRVVSPGAWVTQGQELAMLYDVSKIKIDFRLPERHVGALSVGDAFHFRRNSFEPWSKAVVVMLDPAIDQATRSLSIRGEAPNQEARFLPGAFVEVEVALSRSAEAIMVPSEAVIPESDGALIYVAEDGKSLARKIVLGERTASRVEVLEGLAPGERIITSNLLRIRAGGAIKIVTEASTADAPAPSSDAPLPTPTPFAEG